MKLATRTIRATETKHRYVDAQGNVVRWTSSTLPTCQCITIELEGEVTLEVNVEALLRMLGGKALTSKGRKAIEASGAVVVTARVTSTKAGDWK